MQIYEKYYLTDHGFHHAIVEDNNNKITRILENIVYIELLRRGFTVKVGKIYDQELILYVKNLEYINIFKYLTKSIMKKQKKEKLHHY